MSEKTKWCTEPDINGNVICLKCHRYMGQSFKACVHCCQHHTLSFVMGHHELRMECADCGATDFDDEVLAKRYIAKRLENEMGI